MLQKVEYHHKVALEGTDIQNEIIVQEEDDKEEISDMSDTSIIKPSICFYPVVTNEKGKSYKKSRRCILCTNLSIAYCSCCNKAYCYSVGGKKHDQTCLVDHIKFMKRRMSRKRTRSCIV